MSLPAIKGERALTESQAEFVRLVAEGVDLTDAGQQSGLPGSKRQLQAFLASPAGSRALEKTVQQMLNADSVLARQMLHNLLVMEGVGERIRFEAAKLVLGIAGHSPKTAAPASAVERQLADMSAEDLRTFIARQEKQIDEVEAELAARATPVNAPGGVPANAPGGADISSMLE